MFLSLGDWEEIVKPISKKPVEKIRSNYFFGKQQNDKSLPQRFNNFQIKKLISQALRNPHRFGVQNSHVLVGS